MNEIVRRTKWAELIRAAWKQSVDNVIRIGQLLMRAKADLEHGEFLQMLERELPFKPRTAQMLMAISDDERLTDARRASLLPMHYSTLYELTKLPDDALDAKFADGTINPEMERATIRAEVKKNKRTSRERDLGEKQNALPDEKFGVLVADPEWRFEPWSRETGMDRAADNHYPTSCLKVIASRDVASIAADDCILFLWATAPMLPQALLVMGAWGFDYRSNYVWSKDRIGTGYWNRNAHEHLLIGVKGNIPAPAPGTQRPSLIEGRVTKHSAKPECFLEMIEGYFPTLPKIELNRRGPPRQGWSAWGNQSQSAALSPTRTQSAVVAALTELAPPVEDAAPVPGLSAATSQSGTGVSFWAER